MRRPIPTSATSRPSRLLAEHHTAVRLQLETWKGHEVKTTGDGFLATFDSPARALQCARGIRDAIRRLGLEVRAGVHTGECEVTRDDVAGIAVHVAARDGHGRAERDPRLEHRQGPWWRDRGCGSPTGGGTNSRASRGTGRSMPSLTD